MSFRIFTIFLLLFSIQLSGLTQQDISDGFFDEELNSSWTLPVGIRFDEAGNAFVWEKSGRVYTLDVNTGEKNLLIDISEEVASWGDHGLTGFALDPDFLYKGYVYLAYTVDRHHLFNFGTPEYNPDSSILVNATIGRVSRYSIDIEKEPYQYIEGSNKVIIGKDKTDGFPIMADFHGVGSIAFGEDGSLMVGCGDGGLDYEPNVSYHTGQALEDGIIDSTAVIGVYRSQSLHSLNGKIVRLNPETGDGLPSNPFYDADRPRSAKSRIWALGFRNPYKFFHVPETGSHSEIIGDPGKFFVGDVGSSYWEEMNLLEKAGSNFGWPLYEGVERAWPFGFTDTENPFAPNTAYNNDCGFKNLRFYDLINEDNLGQNFEYVDPCSGIPTLIPDSIPTFVHRRPFVSYNNKTWNQPTRTNLPIYDVEGNASAISIADSEQIESEIFEGYSALPSAWYEEGSLPDSLNHSLLACDYSGWIKAFHFNEQFELEYVLPIRQSIGGVVDLAVNPIDDCIYYVNIIDNRVHRICFGGNPPPIAVAKADTLYGFGELSVQFDASDSYDPNQLPIEVEWDFGDGNKSQKWAVEHTFKSNSGQAQKFTVKLTVKDSLGEIGMDSLFISLNNTPPEIQISSPIDGSFYSINGYNRIDLKSQVSDDEQSEDQLNYTWQVHLHHNTHFHSEEPIHSKEQSVILEPVGCAERDLYWYRINVKVEDGFGLESNDEVEIFPNCDFEGNIQWLAYDSHGQDIILNWEKDELPEFEKFIVQRVEPSGQVVDLGTIQATDSEPYSWIDTNPREGRNQYRIKIFTTADRYHYSVVKNATFPVIKNLKAFPNPVLSGLIQLIPEQEFIGKTILRVFDMSGKQVYEKEYLGERHQKLRLKTDNLAAGLYFIEIRNNQRIYSKKIEVF